MIRKSQGSAMANWSTNISSLTATAFSEIQLPHELNNHNYIVKLPNVSTTLHSPCFPIQCCNQNERQGIIKKSSAGMNDRGVFVSKDHISSA